MKQQQPLPPALHLDPVRSHCTENHPGGTPRGSQARATRLASRATQIDDPATAAESQAQAPEDTRGGAVSRKRGEGAKTSKYRGVQWDKNGQRWRARLFTDKTRHIGESV
jgi:AP2 domain